MIAYLLVLINFKLPDSFSKGKLGYGITYDEAKLCESVKNKEFDSCIRAFDD